MNISRPSIHDYMFVIAVAASLRSTCSRRKVGAVLVKDKRVISTGYNGAPPELRNCFGEGCILNGSCINTIHAEINCIIRAREVGDMLFSTDQPCLSCLKALISHNPDIHIYYLRPYDDLTRDMFMDMHPKLKEQIHRVTDTDNLKEIFNESIVSRF